ncbi:MAG: serine/threonine protein kinase [Eubacteriales bacterium]
MIEMSWWIPAIIAGIPTGITGLCFWILQKKLEKRDKIRDETEAAREQNEVMLIQKIDAALCLGEATARAVQRIPDAHCNGDMHEALEYAEKVKQAHRTFLTEQGVQHLYK